MPLSLSQLKRNFGSFTYEEDPRREGAILIDQHWIAAQIVQLKTPFGRFPCHKKVFCQMKGFVLEADNHALIHDIGGIWVPRHILWDRRRPLSGHAFGCEMDINVRWGSDGPGSEINYGANSYQPPQLIDIARSWGFEWGGSWNSSKDGMHFAVVKPGVRTSCTGTLKLKDTGEQVKVLQRLLNYTGDSGLSADGVFGQLTNTEVLEFQGKHGLEVDGIVGKQTWEALLNWR